MRFRYAFSSSSRTTAGLIRTNLNPSIYGTALMTKVITAIFEKGTLIPMTSLEGLLTEGQQIRVVIETEEDTGDILKLATSVYDGLEKEQVEEIEEIAFDRSQFFSE